MPYKMLIFFFSAIATLYIIFYTTNTFPLERRTVPYASENTYPEKRYSYYTIWEENGQIELMRIPLIVHIGDEVLSADNNLYQVVQIEENRAYARFLRKIKL